MGGNNRFNQPFGLFSKVGIGGSSGTGSLPHYIVEFTHLFAPSFILKNYGVGDSIRVITVSIYEVFDAGIKATLGFPAQNDEIAKQNEIDMQKIGNYSFPIYRISAIAESLTFYFINSPTQGKGRIFVEE